jgi:hypothetical protein
MVLDAHNYVYGELVNYAYTAAPLMNPASKYDCVFNYDFGFTKPTHLNINISTATNPVVKEWKLPTICTGEAIYSVMTMDTFSPLPTWVTYTTNSTHIIMNFSPTSAVVDRVFTVMI